MLEDMVIESFDSIEDAWAFIQAQHDAADARMTPSQHQLADGKEHWYFTWSGSLPIAGHITAMDKLCEHEAKFYDLNDPEAKAEYEYTCRHLRDGLARNVVQVRAFSSVEPDGELGSTHVAGLVPISQAAFKEFRLNGHQVSKYNQVLFEDLVIGLSRIRGGQ